MTRPRLVYDDDCGFCTRSALFVARNADVDLVPFSELPDDLRERLPEDWRACAHLVVGDTVYSCGEAMERAFELTGLPPSQVTPLFRHVPGYSALREAGYRWIADHRPLVGRLTRRFL